MTMEIKKDNIDELIDFCLSRAEIDCFTDEQFKIRETYYAIVRYLNNVKAVDFLNTKKIDQMIRDRIRDLVQIDITCPMCGTKYSIEKLNAWPEDNNEQTNRDI